jgi:hypothetical protein
VSRSLRRTRSAHGAKRPKLPPPLQGLRCVSVEASHGFCMSPAEMLSVGSSHGTCTPNGAKPKPVSAFCPTLCVAMLISSIVMDYPATHFEALVAPSSTFSPSSPALRHTPHHPVTPLQHPLLFSALPSSALARPPYLSIILIFNIYVPRTQWSTPFSHLFAGKMHQATSHPVHLVDLVALPLLAYRHG